MRRRFLQKKRLAYIKMFDEEPPEELVAALGPVLLLVEGNKDDAVPETIIIRKIFLINFFKQSLGYLVTLCPE